jgi:hypothetical protein
MASGKIEMTQQQADLNLIFTKSRPAGKRGVSGFSELLLTNDMTTKRHDSARGTE